MRLTTQKASNEFPLNITNFESAVKAADLGDTFRFFFKSYLQFFGGCPKVPFDFSSEKG
jgi:hypothetical protein